mgnify:CR=1 FL=1
MKSYAKTAGMPRGDATVSPAKALRGAYGKKTGEKLKKSRKNAQKGIDKPRRSMVLYMSCQRAPHTEPQSGTE